VEFLTDGYNIPEIRAELYCQIIKQLTANPSPQSKDRAYELFLYMLSTLAPPPDIENFVEQFIRSSCNPVPRYLNTLHQTLYAQQPVAINEQSLQNFQRLASIYSTMEFCPAATLPHELPPALQQQQQQQFTGMVMQQAQMNGYHPQQQQQQQQQFGASAYNQPQPASARKPSMGQFSSDMSRTQPTPSNGMGMQQPQQQRQVSYQQQQQMGSGGSASPSPSKPAPPPPPSKYRKGPVEPPQEWHYIDKDGEQKGPASSKDLKEQYKMNAVDDECIVWCSDLTEWTKINEVKDLFAYLKF